MSWDEDPYGVGNAVRFFGADDYPMPTTPQAYLGSGDQEGDYPMPTTPQRYLGSGDQEGDYPMPTNPQTPGAFGATNWSKLLKGLTSPAGIAGLGGAALGLLDRRDPSGGGTTMAYPGAAQLQRRMVQGPYGPLAEYTGVGGGAPDYTPFVAPTFGAPDVGGRPTPTTAPGPGAGLSVQAKVDLYKQMRGYGLSDARARRIAESMFGPQTDSDWAELGRLAGMTGGIAGAATLPARVTTPPPGGITTLDSTAPPGGVTAPNVGSIVMDSRSPAPAPAPTSSGFNTRAAADYIKYRKLPGTEGGSASAIRSMLERDYGPQSQEQLDAYEKAYVEHMAYQTAQNSEQDKTAVSFTGPPSLQVSQGDTAEEKAAEYRRLRQFMSDSQIRAMVDAQMGKQTDEDWQALLNLAMPSATPTGQQTSNTYKANQGIASLTEPIGYKAGDAQTTFGNPVYGPRYEAELKDDDLRNALVVSGAKAVADASTAGGVYQRGDLAPAYTPNFSDPASVAQFEQYYPHAKQYGTSFFTPDVLEVDPGFAAYRNQGAEAAIENAAEEARTRGEDPDAARKRIRAEQDALHNRLYHGKGLLAGASDAGGSSIDPAFLSSLGVDPYAGLDTSFRSALDLKPYESYTAPGETNPWGQYKEVLPALDVASGRLSYEQGQAIKQGYEANKNLQSLTQQTNIRDQMIKNLQNELANLKYDPANLESYNRTREDLISRIQSMGGETEQFKQNLAQSQDAMKPYTDTLSGIKDWSGLSSNLIKGGLGLAHGGLVHMEDGGFVLTKRAVDGAGGPRGIQQLVPGARMIRGPGTGTSDDIPAVINGRNGQTPARLSNGEAYVPKRFVQAQGGPQRMYALMNNLQRKA